ncbi:MAG: tetratricopeptide repeat protein [Acidobacteria bacterium]|nr:tetratricopeptide repeat protein [Acidobacteriota bacterium]
MLAALLLSSLLLAQAVPASFQTLSQRGQVALEAGRLDEAEAAFQQARELQPESADVYFNLGEVASRRERPGEAIPHFRQAIRLAPGKAEFYLRLAALEAQLKRLHDAERTLNQLLRLRPRNADAHLLLGRVARERDDSASAEKHLRQYLRLRPRDPAGLVELAAVLLFDVKSAEGEALLKRALAIDPSLGVVHYNLGLLYSLRGDDQRAKPQLEEALQRLPAHTDAHYQLGTVLARLGELGGAEKAFRRALELSPGHVESLYALGTLLNRQGHSQEAAAILAEHEKRSAAALEQRQRERRVSAFHSDVKRFLEENRLEAAEEKLNEILQLDPENDLAHYRRSQILFLRRDYPRALETVRSAIEKRDFEPSYYLLEAMCWERLGHDQEAAQAYERVVSLADYADAYLALGQIELRQGRHAEAVAHLRRAAALEPEDLSVRQALNEALAAEAGKKEGRR